MTGWLSAFYRSRRHNTRTCSPKSPEDSREKGVKSRKDCGKIHVLMLFHEFGQFCQTKHKGVAFFTENIVIICLPKAGCHVAVARSFGRPLVSCSTGLCGGAAFWAWRVGAALEGAFWGVFGYPKRKDNGDLIVYIKKQSNPLTCRGCLDNKEAPWDVARYHNQFNQFLFCKSLWQNVQCEDCMKQSRRPQEGEGEFWGTGRISLVFQFWSLQAIFGEFNAYFWVCWSQWLFVATILQDFTVWPWPLIVFWFIRCPPFDWCQSLWTREISAIKSKARVPSTHPPKRTIRGHGIHRWRLFLVPNKWLLENCCHQKQPVGESWYLIVGVHRTVWCEHLLLAKTGKAHQSPSRTQSNTNQNLEDRFSFEKSFRLPAVRRAQAQLPCGWTMMSGELNGRAPRGSTSERTAFLNEDSRILQKLC